MTDFSEVFQRRLGSSSIVCTLVKFADTDDEMLSHRFLRELEKLLSVGGGAGGKFVDSFDAQPG